MQHTADTTEIFARINSLDAEHIRLHSPLSGPLDLKSSLSDHFDQALGLGTLFPTDLRDQSMRACLEKAFASETARVHFNLCMQRPAHSPVLPLHVALLQKKLAYTVILALDGTLAGDMGDTTPATHPYTICSLAQTLWTRQVCRTRSDCFIAAAVLRHGLDPAPPTMPRRPSRPLVLDDYLALPLLVEHLLAPPAGTNTLTHLLEAFGASLYAQGRRYRPPTARELAAGQQPNAYGKVMLPGHALNAPPSQVLDALLHSASFVEWARNLADSAAWDSTSDYLALGEQALVDTLYPPEARRAGFILDFELFSATNETLSPEEIRLDLTNSVQASLGCSPAIAALLSELLMRRFAPELLLEDYPLGFAYTPDTHWATLRQGAMMLMARQRPMTLEQVEQVLQWPQQEDDPIPAEALQDTLALWAQIKGEFDHSPPWSEREWQLALHRYQVVCDQESLRDLPDRFAEARLQLRLAGVDPQGRNIDGQLHLQQYLDHGAGYRNIARLPDVTAWYEDAFKAWTHRAKGLYQAMLQRCLGHLPLDHHDRLRDGPWTAYAVTWPSYIGNAGRPAYGQGADEDWHWEVGTQGMVVHAPGEDSDLLYELFPERVQWRVQVLPAVQPAQLAEHLTLNYDTYNQTALPWLSADFPTLRELLTAPDHERLTALASCYADSIALGNRDALHALGKGLSDHERFLASRLTTSLGRYLLKLFSNIVPGVSCIAPRTGTEALSCGLDVLMVAGGAISVAGRLFKPIRQLSTVLGESAMTAHQGMVRAARRLSHESAASAFSQRTATPRRWHSAPELSRSTADDLMVQRQALPGQTPDALLLDRIPGNNAPLAWEHATQPRLIYRDAENIDAIVQGVAYRQRPAQAVARRLQHEPLLTQAPSLEGPLYPNGEARIALRFTPAPNDAGTPLLGQQVSHAFQTVRIEPAPIRFRPQNTRYDTWAQVMVREGKVVQHAPGHPNRIKPLPVDETQLRLGVIAPPVYHRRIVVDPSAEIGFGLPDDLPIEQIRMINQHCPPVRLGGLARTIADRRTLRGAVIDWRGEQWLVVEADLGVFYGARYQPWGWQAALPVLPSEPGKLAQAPRNLRRYFDRIRDEEAIDRYLEISETYRIVTQRPNLQRDIDNLTQLLRDWIEQTTAFEPVQRSPFMDILQAAQSRLLPLHARNILTHSPAQDALAGLARSGVIGLNREIIPAWRQFNQASLVERQHLLGVLDDLLPATGSTAPYTLSASTPLLDASALIALRQHLHPANLAFASVTLRDQSRLVFFSLSGTPGRRVLEIVPTVRQTPNIRYIDARQTIQGLPSDPRFSELTTLRRADFLSVRHHKRHLDAERQIATALNHALLARSAEVESIAFFTLLDTCRSCGGYVLPRLRLDYPQATFSVTWMLEYPV